MSAGTSAVKALAAYIKANSTAFKLVSTEWPDPKVRLDLPSVSIITVGSPKHIPQMPSIKSISATLDPLKKSVLYLVGEYEFNIQFDLWTDYKVKRGELYDEVLRLLDKQFSDNGSPTGLSLEMADYHNIIARYDHLGYTYMDSEENSDRQEWRVKIDILVTHSRVVEKTESIMDEITLKTRIDEYVDVENDQTNEEKII